MGKRSSAVLLTALLGASTFLAQQPTLIQQATSAFNSAQKADKALNEKSDPTRSEVLKVINAYEKVYLITPATGYADDALIAIARLYESIRDKNDAIKTLTFMIREYPQSPFKEQAERDIARLNNITETVPAIPPNKPETKTDSRSNSKAATAVTVDNIRYWEGAKTLRVVVDLSGEISFKQGEAKSPDRVFIDISHAHLNPSLMSKEWPVQSGLLQKIRVGQNDTGTVRVVLDVGGMLRATSFTLRDPNRLVIDVEGDEDVAIAPPAEPARRTMPPVSENVPAIGPAPAPVTANASRGPAKAAAVPSAPAPAAVAVTRPEIGPPPYPGPQMASAAQPLNQGTNSLIRALGLKFHRVIIDAGHGGHDTGSIGPTGYTEKDLTLDVAKRLKTLIETELGADVVMTRGDDTFIPLETRTAIANQKDADLFISIHANSSKTRTVRGVETYFLNFTSSREALETASRENAASERSIHELSDLVKKIVTEDKVDESRELARHIQTAMSKSKDAGPDRGVKQAPFVVLIGARVPSILAEISFISNPDEEKVLKTPQYRQQIAESLLNGVRSYADSLSNVKTAKALAKN